MTFPAIISVLALAGAQDATPYAQPQGVSEPSRLAITPTIDGTIALDEWDFFTKSNDGETYLQWEPGRLYVAGKIPVDRDLVLSLDNNQDGWLVGKDSFEFRLRMVDGKAKLICRQLDATNVAGPKWVGLPAFEKVALIQAKSNEATVQMEAAILDPGLGLLPVRADEKYLMRIDVVAQSAQDAEPFYPRVGTLVKLMKERASAMPVGLTWKVEDRGRELIPGESSRIRFSFSAKEDVGLRKIEIKPMGPLADHATVIGQPFPAFDKKGRTFVDYQAKTTADAPTGYHLVSTTLMTADGSPAVIQASVRVSPIVDMALASQVLEIKSGDQEVKIAFLIRSNAPNRLEGNSTVIAPAGWEVTGGDETSFTINRTREGVRRILTVRIPAEAAGTFAFRFKAVIGQKEVEVVDWMRVVRK
ncbi:MAG: hypothetical protein H7Y17_02730 [Chlorobia bacterium]|nr:hypothetical protein [Fimbriimonadaceae bacterium]